MTEFFSVGSFGPLLSKKDYQRRVAELYSTLPPSPSRAEQEEVRRAELDLAIDFRLGIRFPDSRRAELWRIQQKVERRRGRLIFRYLVRALWPFAVEHGAASLSDYLLEEYRKALSPSEMQRFFAGDQDRGP